MNKIIAFVQFQKDEGEKESKEVVFDIRCVDYKDGLHALEEMVEAHEVHNHCTMVNIDTRFIKA